MKCFTTYNDLVPYQGFTLGNNDRIGINYQFCLVLPDPHRFETPFIHEIKNQTYFDPKCEGVEIKGIIKAAYAVEQMGIPNTTLVAPKYTPETDHLSALIYWAINENTSFGKVDQAVSLLGLDIFAKESINKGHLEFLFALDENSLTEVVFDTGKKLTLRFQNQRLQFLHHLDPELS